MICSGTFKTGTFSVFQFYPCRGTNRWPSAITRAPGLLLQLLQIDTRLKDCCRTDIQTHLLPPKILCMRYTPLKQLRMMCLSLPKLEDESEKPIKKELIPILHFIGWLANCPTRILQKSAWDAVVESDHVINHCRWVNMLDKQYGNRQFERFYDFQLKAVSEKQFLFGFSIRSFCMQRLSIDTKTQLSGKAGLISNP